MSVPSLSSESLRLSSPPGRLLQPGGEVRRHRQGAHHPTHAADGGAVWHLQPRHRSPLQHLQLLRTRGEWPWTALAGLRRRTGVAVAPAKIAPPPMRRFTFTLTFRAFSRRFYPKRLTMSTFQSEEGETIYCCRYSMDVHSSSAKH